MYMYIGFSKATVSNIDFISKKSFASRMGHG